MHQSDTELFFSRDAFRRGFESGLARLLDDGGLNLFILAAANAGFDARLFDSLRARLQHAYVNHRALLRTAFADGGVVDEADDDLLVFLKMACIGFDALTLTEQRMAGVWEVQFNHLRSFRPLRNSQRPMTSIQAPFEEQGFNFNKPFMQQEVLWSGELLDTRFNLYFNKYPFVDLHCLLVPERELCLPQYHREDMHGFVWQLVRQLSAGLPGIRVGYNALGAYASVNHLHYQLFVRDDPLPVEQAQWQHNGGGEYYPVACHVFTDVDEAWRYIDGLHARNETYNLLYTPECMYCMPRRKQGDFRLAAWSSGYSWYEMSGGMITFNHRHYAQLQAEQIDAQLRCARLEREEAG
jgi:hypothetical protein